MNLYRYMGQKSPIGLIAAVSTVVVLAVPGYGQVIGNAQEEVVIRQVDDVFGPIEYPEEQADDEDAAPEDTLITGSIEEAPSENRLPAQRSNIGIGAVEPGVRPAQEDDPYAATGIAIGTLRLTSFLRQSIGFTTNKENTTIGEGGAFSLTEFDFQLRSGWQIHELAINASGEYESFFDGEIEASPRFNLDGSLRLDFRDGFAGTFGGNYAFANESATSTNLTAAAINEPGVHSYGIFAQLQRGGGRLDATLRATIDRRVYEDAELAGGGTFSQVDRNVTNYGVSARLAYQTGLAFSPFVQAGYSAGVFDEEFDRNGERRDSTTYVLRGGVALDFGEKLSGEISAGYGVQQFVDPGLAALAGIVIDANFNWSPQRDTNIALTFGSDFGGSTNAGDSGAITYNGELAINRRVRDNLELNGKAGISYTNFEGLNRIDSTYTAGLGFEYWLNRTLSLTGDAEYEMLDSSDALNSYDAATFTLGVKVQR